VKNGFNTPSRKVEFYSEYLKKFGNEPLPTFRSPRTKPLNRYPLIGTTRRPGIYVHTRFRNLPMLKKRQPDPFVRLHPRDAKPRGIEEGDWTVVESPQGSIRMKARVTTELQPGLVIIDFGWGNSWDEAANVNVITSDDERDPISSTTPNRRFLCQVKKA